jgi:hypothetical protein
MSIGVLASLRKAIDRRVSLFGIEPFGLSSLGKVWKGQKAGYCDWDGDYTQDDKELESQ